MPCATPIAGADDRVHLPTLRVALFSRSLPAESCGGAGEGGGPAGACPQGRRLQGGGPRHRLASPHTGRGRAAGVLWSRAAHQVAAGFVCLSRTHVGCSSQRPIGLVLPSTAARRLTCVWACHQCAGSEALGRVLYGRVGAQGSGGGGGCSRPAPSRGSLLAASPRSSRVSVPVLLSAAVVQTCTSNPPAPRLPCTRRWS